MRSLIGAMAMSTALVLPGHAQVTPGEEMTCGDFAALTADEQEATLRELESTSADAGGAGGADAAGGAEADASGAAGADARADAAGGAEADADALAGADAGDAAGADAADAGGAAGADADAAGMDVAAVLEACAADPEMPVIEAMRSPM